MQPNVIEKLKILETNLGATRKGNSELAMSKMLNFI